MEGINRRTAQSESQERPAGQTWVIVIRACRGAEKSADSLINVLCVRDNSRSRASHESHIYIWAWGMLCQEPLQSKVKSKTKVVRRDTGGMQ